MSGLALLALLVPLGAVLAWGLLQGIKYPALLVALSIYTLSLDRLARLGGESSFITIHNLLKLLLVVVLLIWMMTAGRRVRIPRHLVWFLPYLLFAGLSSFYSPDLRAAGFYFLRLTLVWVYAVVVANLIRSRRDLVIVVAAMGVTALVVSTLAHLQTLNALTQTGVVAFQKQGPDASSIRALGTFWDANTLGGFLAIVSVYLVAMLGQAGLSRKLRAGILAILFVAFGAILLSFSRGSWLFVALAMLFFYRYRNLRRAVLGFYAIGLVGLLYLVFFTPYGLSLLSRLGTLFSLGEDYSGRFRWFLVLSGFEIWAEGMRWLWGGGYYAFNTLIWENWYPLATHDMVYHSGTHTSHTLYTTILAEGGLIGLGLFLLFFRAVFGEIRRLFRAAPSGLPRALLQACAVIALVKVFDFFLDPSIYDNMLWLTFGLLGALDAVIGERAEPPAAPAQGAYQT